MDVLIDGYNLLHAAYLARTRYGPGGLQRARDRLVAVVQHGFTELELSRVTIIFDAKESPGGGEVVLARSGLQIEYARAGGEADERIEELIQQHTAPRQLLVVSSDHRLQQAARRRQAGYIDSETFLQDVERRRQRLEQQRRAPPTQANPKDQGLQSASELSEWLSAFENIELGQIAEEVEQETRRQMQTEEARKQLKTDAIRTASPPAPSAQDPSQRSPSGEYSLGERSPGTVLPEGEIEFWERRVRELLDEST